MGNSITRYHLDILFSRNRDIISEKALRAVVIVINYLKQNADNILLFRTSGNPDRMRRIAIAISRGSDHIRNILETESALEIAAGLQYFLIRLKKPLIPSHIQALALDVEEGIQPELVAYDILGLIRQDIKERHLVLIVLLLDLMRIVRMSSVGDELAGSGIPVTMLPIFFNLQVSHIPKWRTIATIFVEMIWLAPIVLPRSTSLTLLQVPRINFINSLENGGEPIQGNVLEISLVLGQYLINART